MNRLFAAVAISALALSGAAFAADAPAASPALVQKAQAPATTTATPAKPVIGDSQVKKSTSMVKKSDSKASTETTAPVTK
jgi:hypothetical protein